MRSRAEILAAKREAEAKQQGDVGITAGMVTGITAGMKEEAIDNIMTIPVYYPPLLGDATTLLRSVEQVTYAIAYMTLEAEKYGVGCCVIGALGNEVTKFAPDIYKQVKDKLNLNDKHCIITMLTLGYEKEKQPLNKYRKEFDEVISLEKLGNKF